MSVRPALSRRGFSPPQNLSICSQYCAVVFENQFILPWCRDYYGSSSRAKYPAVDVVEEISLARPERLRPLYVPLKVRIDGK